FAEYWGQNVFRSDLLDPIVEHFGIAIYNYNFLISMPENQKRADIIKEKLADTYHRFGRAYISFSLISDAIGQYTQAVNIYKDVALTQQRDDVFYYSKAVAHQALGDALMINGDAQKALTEYENAKKDYRQAYERTGTSYLMDRGYGKLIISLGDAIKSLHGEDSKVFSDFEGDNRLWDAYVKTRQIKKDTGGDGGTAKVNYNVNTEIAVEPFIKDIETALKKKGISGKCVMTIEGEAGSGKNFTADQIKERGIENYPPHEIAVIDTDEYLPQVSYINNERVVIDKNGLPVIPLGSDLEYFKFAEFKGKFEELSEKNRLVIVIGLYMPLFFEKLQLSNPDLRVLIKNKSELSRMRAIRRDGYPDNYITSMRKLEELQNLLKIPFDVIFTNKDSRQSENPLKTQEPSTFKFVLPELYGKEIAESAWEVSPDTSLEVLSNEIENRANAVLSTKVDPLSHDVSAVEAVVAGAFAVIRYLFTQGEKSIKVTMRTYESGVELVIDGKQEKIPPRREAFGRGETLLSPLQSHVPEFVIATANDWYARTFHGRWETSWVPEQGNRYTFAMPKVIPGFRDVGWRSKEKESIFENDLATHAEVKMVTVRLTDQGNTKIGVTEQIVQREGFFINIHYTPTFISPTFIADAVDLAAFFDQLGIEWSRRYTEQHVTLYEGGRAIAWNDKPVIEDIIRKNTDLEFDIKDGSMQQKVTTMRIDTPEGSIEHYLTDNKHLMYVLSVYGIPYEFHLGSVQVHIGFMTFVLTWEDRQVLNAILIEFLRVQKQITVEVDKAQDIANDGGFRNVSETAKDKRGGIDFRSLPITTQPVLAIQPNLQVPLQPKIPLAELDKEWSSIQEMVNKGNIPSGETIKEYVLSCCQKGDISQDMEKVLACIFQILRLEEDYAVACEPGFIQLLSILESDKPPHELQLALSAVLFGS
ncbi:MAG: hypothetical protein PHC33_05430, partial [Candidatus Omnitrophica bacterium]|nr:hypothetical protein [Candidatus Omnitrophota bacterium]